MASHYGALQGAIRTGKPRDNLARGPSGSCTPWGPPRGKGQVEGDGLCRQPDAIARYAKLSGVQLLEEYRDEGVSGTRELEGRAGLAALMDRVESNGVRLVLVERADRLARDLLVSEIILGRFRDMGVRVVAAESGTELTVEEDNPTRKLIRQVLGAVAEYYKTLTVMKLRAARDRMRQKLGCCEGRKPFGMKPGEAESLELIHELYRKPRGGERRSHAEIAAELNRRGVKSRTGRPWSRGTVWAIVRAQQQATRS